MVWAWRPVPSLEVSASFPIALLGVTSLAGYISDQLQFWQSAIVMAGVVLLPQFPLVGVYIYERVRKGRMH